MAKKIQKKLRQGDMDKKPSLLRATESLTRHDEGISGFRILDSGSESGMTGKNGCHAWEQYVPLQIASSKTPRNDGLRATDC